MSDDRSARETVDQWLADRFGEYRVERRLHAVPPHAVYEVTADGRRAVFKCSTDPRGDAGIEGRAQRLGARETALDVPEVPWVGDGAYLAAYDEDAPDPDSGTATEEWCRAAGRGLAELHSARFDRHGLLAVDGDPADRGAGLRVDADPGATWPDALDDLLGVFRGAVAGTEYTGVVDDAREFVREYADRFSGVDPVLVHGWFGPEHVAVRDGEVRSVVDFEHAMAGAAEYDLWRTAIPTFGAGDGDPADPEGWAAFREGYGAVRPLPQGFEERRDAYRALVGASYLDSLVTQRGIEGNRDRADAIRASVAGTLADLRARWR